MCEIRKITDEQKKLLDAPLPAEAVTQHPTKTFLSSIKSVYVTERFNDVFGVGAWRVRSEVVERADKGMVVVKVLFSIPEYGVEYECYGGNNNGGESSKNFDQGDAYKGAVTDAISKIGSWMGVGANVFKGRHRVGSAIPHQASDPIAATPPAVPTPRKQVTMMMLDDQVTCDSFLSWAYKGRSLKDPATFDAGDYLAYVYDVDEKVKNRFRALFASYAAAKNTK